MFLLEGHWLSFSDCSKNLCSARETCHPKAHWVRNEGVTWVSFLLISPWRELGWLYPEELVRSTSFCLPISLHSQTPQMGWQFSASINIRTCDCDVFQSKIIQHTNFTWKPWQLQVGGMCRGSCVFVVVLLDSSILCGKKKQTMFYYVEGGSFLNLESFITWIIVFYICQTEEQELRKSSVLDCSRW